MFESETRPIWWLPTLGLFFFLAIELSMFAGVDKFFEDPGVGRHLRTAEFILESGKIPHADPLSFTHGGEPWIDYEWGFETTMGELYRVGGLALVGAFCYAIFAATILGMYRMVLHTGASLSVVILVIGMVFLTLHMHFAVRPVLFTYLFLPLVVEVWYRRVAPLRRDWILLPVVFVFWVNLHAGWSAALVFLAGSIFGRVLDRISKRVNGEEAPIIPWVGLLLLCVLATWFNPWGWTMHRQVYLWTTSYKSFALWDEYLPPNFWNLSMSAITILFVLTVVFFSRVCKDAPRWKWEMVLPILFFLYEGLKAQRHVLFLMEIAAVPLARDLQVLMQIPWPQVLRQKLPLITELLEGMGERFREFQAKQRLAGGDAWLAIIAALACAWLFMRTPIGHEIEVSKNVTPQLVDFIKDHPDRFHRPMTTTWNAGPLLWKARPDFRDSIDDRGDFFGDDVVFYFVATTNGSAGWDEKLKKGNYDSLILDPYLQINQLLRFMPEWKEAYRDEHAVVYWKNTAGSP